MIHWILERLEQNPHATFSEAQLLNRNALAFAALVARGVLQRSDRHARTLVRNGRLLTVEEVEPDRWEATDDDDPELDPVVILEPELTLWKLDHSAFGAYFQVLNVDVRGPVARLDDRLWQLGEASPSTSVVLAFAQTGHQLVELAGLLRITLPERYDHHVVLLPHCQPSSLVERTLEGMGCLLTQVVDDSLALDPPLERSLGQIQSPGGYDRELGVRWSGDFRSVIVAGAAYSFTGPEARAFRLYFDALRNGTPDLSDAYVQEQIGSEARDLRDTMRRWRLSELLIEGKTRGTRRLNLSTN